MEQQLILEALKINIEHAFKSLMESGRSDIVDGDENSLIGDLYEDLFDDNYILRQVVDKHHLILKGRRGTGKSTIFVRAEQDLKKEHKECLPIYINLQTCYEKTSVNKVICDEVQVLETYKAFLNQIFKQITENISKKLKNSDEINKLQKEIEEGQYIDLSFTKEYDITEGNKSGSSDKLGFTLSPKEIKVEGALEDNDENSNLVKYNTKEVKVYKIHEILAKIKNIIKKSDKNYVYLFLDDFSELSMDNQKVIIDAIISPIISSYNDTFIVKLAAYPNRIYLGNIDSTKIPVVPLDFYEAFGQVNPKIDAIERSSIEFIRKTLEKRLSVFTNNQITLSEIFEINENTSINDYLYRLFEITSAIPRCIGFILNYCYLPSINAGKPITMSNLDVAASKYYSNNLLSDFINDIRFKQAFHDDKKMLDQLSQKCLLDGIVKYLFDVKRDIVYKYQQKKLENILFTETIENNRNGRTYWLPTSHFYIDKHKEQLLNTLELYFMVNKFSIGSKRGAGDDKVLYYGLNYGLCLEKKIDYGKPDGRRSADYRRSPEFDLSNLIPKILSEIETIKCTECGMVYDQVRYDIYKEKNRCFECGKFDTVKKTNKYGEKLHSKLEEWKSKSISSIGIDILRVLYNSQGDYKSAYEIGQLVDQHHMTIYHVTNRLLNDEYIEVRVTDKRYYCIGQKAISQFFVDDIEGSLE